MSSPGSDPADKAGSSAAAWRGGPRFVDALLFLILIAVVLSVLDVATGWALAGLMHLGRGGVAPMSAIVALPLGYVGYALARVALTGLRAPRDDPDSAG